MRNPKWHRDEIILALDLYFDHNRGSIDARNPKVMALSEVLNKLPLFTVKPDEERFRNANGVSLKLSNFLAIDPKHKGEGMKAYSKLDKAVFEEFANDQPRLKDVARQIKQILANEALLQQISRIEDDENTFNDSVPEGNLIYRYHKYRERNSKIVATKKDTVLAATGKLACEVCDFDFFKTYGSLGKSFIECHHIKPLATYEAATKTKIEDLALVCSNCHRMLHKDLSLGLKGLKMLIQQ